MSTSNMSDASSNISADWQSDDEPHTDAIGDLIPLAVHKSKVVLTNQILTLGTTVEDLDDIATVTVRVLPFSKMAADAGAHSTSDLLTELKEVPQWNTTIRELSESYPEVAEAVRFMAVGTAGLLHKKSDWTFKKESYDFKSIESKRLQHYRTRFARLQGESSTRDNVRQFIARNVVPFAVISLDSAHARQKILQTTALTTVVRKTKIWQIADQKSIVKWRVWPFEKGVFEKYETLSTKPFKEYSMAVEKIDSAALRYLATHMTLGEVLRVEWHEETPPFEDFKDIYIQPVEFQNLTKYDCISDTAPPSLDATCTDCLRESEGGSALAHGDCELNVENTCDLGTILNIQCEDNWEKMRATGIRPVEAGALTVVKIGDEYLAFVMKRTRVLPLWFHSLVARMKSNYQYTMRLEKDMVLIQDAAADGFINDHVFTNLRRYVKALSPLNPEGVEFEGVCADECANSKNPDGGVSGDANSFVGPLNDLSFEPYHKTFGTQDNVTPISIRLDRVYRLEMPHSLAEFNEKGSIKHFSTLPSEYCLKANQTYEVCCLGEISSELNGNSADLAMCLTNCVCLLTQAELFYPSRPAFFASVSCSAELYTHSVLSRILEPDEYSQLQNFCLQSGIQSQFPELAGDQLPKIELMASKLHNTLQSYMLYLNGMRLKMRFEKRAEKTELKSVLECLISAQEAAQDQCSVISTLCHVEIVRILFAAEEYEKCIEYCAKMSSISADLQNISQEAKKLHAANEVKARNMYQKMFR